MDGVGSMARVDNMLQQMMRFFDSSDENVKEMRGGLLDKGGCICGFD